MYSPISKYLSLAAMVFFLASAGVALANHGPHEGFIVCGLLGAVAFMVFSFECKNQGAQPLTKLKPGRRYRVEAMLPELRNSSGGLTTRLVVSWHVDWGHHEYRLAYLPHDVLTRKPKVGGEITPDKPKYGYVRYVVTEPADPVLTGLHGFAG